jgi:hypothetical protein
MDTKQLLLGYLGAGVSQRDAAQAAGVSEAYVSMLLKDDEEFAAKVQEKRTVISARNVAIDELADATQHAALQRLRLVVGYSSSISELTRAVQVLDSMKRRTAPTTAQDALAAEGLVRISLPRGMVGRFAIAVDTTNKVVQVGAQTMVAASGPQLDNMAAKEVRYDYGREAGLLPAAAGGSAQGEAADLLFAPTRAGPESASEFEGQVGGTLGELL